MNENTFISLRKMSLRILSTGVLLIHTIPASIIYTDVNQDSLTVGDRIELTVSLVTAPGTPIVPPETEGGFGKLVVKNWDTQKTERKNSDSVTYKYLLTTYTVEPCTIPALPFIAVSGNTPDTLFSDSLILRVISVIHAKPGDTITLKDIKPLLSAGTPSLLWLWILCGLACVVLGIYLGRYFWLRSRKPPPPPPPKPPYDEAMEALTLLEQKDLMAKGLLREYVFELSEILKRYTGRRFACNAAECTTEEMLVWLKTAPFDKTHSRSLEWFFNTTHPVKFARLVPDRATVQQLLDETRLFIEKTKPHADGKEPPESSEENNA